jgi:hypothetical protein
MGLLQFIISIVKICFENFGLLQFMVSLVRTFHKDIWFSMGFVGFLFAYTLHV